MRIVLDTDVVLSGLRSTIGASRILLLAIEAGVVTPLVSVAIVIEYEAVLKREEHLAASRLDANDVDIFLDAFVAHAVKTSNGTKMPRADWKVLREYPVLVPPPEIGRRYERTVWPMIELAAALASQNRNLRAQRDLLLPKLISGEIDVSAARLQLEAAE